MPDPLVTVVIPSYNHEKWIEQAIRSVAEQDYPNKRIVVVSDASTDRTAEKAIGTMYRPRQPEEQPEVAVYFGQVLPSKTNIMLQVLPENHGCPFTRNWGIKVSWEDTDLFCFLDSDDYFLPGKISRSVAAWQKDPERIGVVSTDYLTRTEKGVFTRVWSPPYSREALVRNNIISQCSMVPKKVLDQVGIFDDTLIVCEDFDEWLRISEHFVIHHIPEALNVKNVGSHDSTATISKLQWAKDYKAIKNKMVARVAKP